MIPPLPQFGKGRPMVSSLDQFKKPGALFRYFWAAHAVKVNGWKSAIDAACGCGYGSQVLVDQGLADRVTGVDVDPDAIEVAEAFWKGPRVTFDLSDILEATVERTADVVVSLETIEHIQEPRYFLETFRRWAPNLVATVPDQAITPFNPRQFRFHFKHYRADEFRELLLEFYDKVEIFPEISEWTKLDEARHWFENKIPPDARPSFIQKLQGNIRAVAT